MLQGASTGIMDDIHATRGQYMYHGRHTFYKGSVLISRIPIMLQEVSTGIMDNNHVTRGQYWYHGCHAIRDQYWYQG